MSEFPEIELDLEFRADGAGSFLLRTFCDADGHVGSDLEGCQGGEIS